MSMYLFKHKGFNFEANSGDIIILNGESRCGKTTVLNIFYQNAINSSYFPLLLNDIDLLDEIPEEYKRNYYRMDVRGIESKQDVFLELLAIAITRQPNILFVDNFGYGFSTLEIKKMLQKIKMLQTKTTFFFATSLIEDYENYPIDFYLKIVENKIDFKRTKPKFIEFEVKELDKKPDYFKSVDRYRYKEHHRVFGVTEKGSDELLGVLTMNYPKGWHAKRNILCDGYFGNSKPLALRDCEHISNVIIKENYRGLGLANFLLKEYLEKHCERKYIEIEDDNCAYLKNSTLFRSVENYFLAENSNYFKKNFDKFPKVLKNNIKDLNIGDVFVLDNEVFTRSKNGYFKNGENKCEVIEI